MRSFYCLLMIWRMRLIKLLAFFLGSCSLQEDFEYTSSNRTIAVNGFIHPDSTIKIQVTHTAPFPNGSSFTPVEEATVSLYEEGVLLDVLPYNSAKGAYIHWITNPGKAMRITCQCGYMDTTVFLPVLTFPSIAPLMRATASSPFMEWGCSVAA